jgi:hypothetical protein
LLKLFQVFAQGGGLDLQFLDVFFCFLEEFWVDSPSCVKGVDHLLQRVV